MACAVSIIIPVFNQWSLTRDCLVSLREKTSDDCVEVIVVDNGSTDGTPTQCPELGAQLFGEDFIFIRNEINRNFGPACNQGARKSRGKYLFFLNNDTVALNDWLTPLLNAMEKDETLGAVGPLLLFPGAKRVQHLGVTVVPGGKVMHLYESIPCDHSMAHVKRDLAAITGAALFIKKELFEICGEFFEGYKNGFEDLDLCFEVKSRGKRLSCVSESCFIHVTSQTAGRFDYDSDNSELIHNRHPEDFYPDCHIHAQRDGLEMRLTSWLKPYLALPQSRIIKIEESSRDMDIPELQRLLHGEPFWTEGYERLAVRLEEIGDFEEANYLRMVHAKLCPSERAFFLLQKGSKKAGNKIMYDQAKSLLAYISQQKKERMSLTASAKGILRWSEMHGETLLAGLYRNWQLS